MGKSMVGREEDQTHWIAEVHEVLEDYSLKMHFAGKAKLSGKSTELSASSKRGLLMSESKGFWPSNSLGYPQPPLLVPAAP